MEEQESRKLRALSDIASIDIALDFEDIMHRILKITCETMKAHSGTMMLVDEDANELKMVSSYGLPEDYIEMVYSAANRAGVPISSSASGIVLKTGEHYTVSNLHEEPKNRPWHSLAKEFGFSSQIFTPMKKGLKVIGLLNVYMSEVHDFNEEEINFVNIAASQASSVVQNARMCSRLKNNIHELNDYKRQLEGRIKETHNALYESEAKYRDLFENAEDSMYTLDLKGFILSVNKAGMHQLGCTENEIVGTNISTWLTPECLKLVEERYKKIHLGEPLDQPFIIEVICKNGEHKWGEVRTSLIRHGNKIIGTHGISRDVTEKISLEQKVKDYHRKLEKSYEELIEADRIKTEFISNITHELLTPLTSIRGFAELLDDETMGKVNAEQKKSLDIILRNSERLIRLIKELLDSSNLENNKLGLQFGLVSINNILSKSIQDIYPQANDKQIYIMKDIQPLPEVWGDEERLMQMITNLLMNAIKFTPHKGKITIRGMEDIEHIKISITDTGIGIPSDKLKTIFDRFYQVDGSSSRKYGGIGLGLSICKNIIYKHYGQIWAESDGHGSTFLITLPKLKSRLGEKHV